MAAPLSPAKLQTIASPLNWITARLSAMLPSSAADAPITPSRPTMAASTTWPLDSVTTIEITALVGK
jgi:hypothetical protein